MHPDTFALELLALSVLAQHEISVSEEALCAEADEAADDELLLVFTMHTQKPALVESRAFIIKRKRGKVQQRRTVPDTWVCLSLPARREFR
jgi:hypothetical protein